MCLGARRPLPPPRTTPSATQLERGSTSERLPLLAPPPPARTADSLGNPDDGLEFDRESGAFFVRRRGAARLRIPLIPLSANATSTRLS